MRAFFLTKSYWLSKNLYFIMVSLKFHDVCDCVYEKRRIEIGTNSFDEDDKPTLIRFELHWGNNGEWEYIDLDKSTAIKFSKELRKQIALLD